MIKAVLFDLDDTLLGNDTETFMPPLYQAWSAAIADLLPHDATVRALRKAAMAMIANVDPIKTNGEVFADAFSAASGIDYAIVERRFDAYYRGDFNTVKSLTTQRDVARPLLTYCFAQGYKVVIATNPMFPLVAIEQRLAWAGVPTTDFDYALITHMDNMHATKPNAAYYREIMAKIDVDPWEAIMVGDDWERDIAPADKLHLATFWVADNDTPAPAPMKATSRGTLEQLYHCCLSGWLNSL